MAFNPFSGYTPDQPPSIYDVQRKQALAAQLIGNKVQNGSALGALADALAGTAGSYENQQAATEAQAGLTQAQAGLGKALAGGYDGIQADPGGYANAMGNPFLPPSNVQAAADYVKNQMDLNTPQAVNPLFTAGFVVPATGKYTPINGVPGGGAGGMAIGQTGHTLQEDQASPDYATKVIPNLGVTQAALDQAAGQYATTGKPPPIGRSFQSQSYGMAVKNRAAEISANANLSTNAATYGADKSSLGDQTKYSNNIQRAFNTANDTLASLQKFMKDNNVNPNQYTDPNKWAADFQSHGPLAGIVGGYNAQLETLRQEYSQVLAKGGARSVETDQKAAKLIPDGLSPSELGQVAAQIKIDADNAMRDATNQVGQIKSDISGIGQPSGAGKVLTYNPATGQLE